MLRPVLLLPLLLAAAGQAAAQGAQAQVSLQLQNGSSIITDPIPLPDPGSCTSCGVLPVSW